ncbi:hypothetical protein LOZ66_004925 [Ophidiomyces ophidiicola]|nr:hypothetical protein LOZ66_004925 [Ophidiomyces ophidiicola]
MPSSSETSASTPSSTAGRPPKPSRKTKLLVLKLSSTSLNRFSASSTPDAYPDSKRKDSPAASSALDVAFAASVDNASEPRSTPPSADAPSAEPSKKKSGTPPKAGTKRGAGSDAGPKPRARPGPKKKIKLDDGSTEPNGRTTTGSGTTGTHKLGPKANQGAINAGLRALDRTGKPCRKWERKSFQLKSFTGTVWQVPSWRAPPKSVNLSLNGVNGLAATLTDDNNSSKENNVASSAIPSERSNIGDNDTPPFPGNAESSPASIAAAA